MTDMDIFLPFMVVGEGISFVLYFPCAHKAVLGGFEADEAELFLELGSAEFLEDGVRHTTPASSDDLEGLLLWRWRRWI